MGIFGNLGIPSETMVSTPMESIQKNEYEIRDTILKVENVSVKFKKNGIEKTVIQDINFEIHDVVRPGVEQGQIVSILGQSGVGKSVLFNVLAGLKKPTTGNILIDLDQHPVHPGEVGVVTQNYVLFTWRTVRENLELALKANKSLSNDKNIINEYAEKFNLKDHLNKYPNELSGGQKQRTSIVQQILSGNKFILFDEPFSGLDCLMIDKVLDILTKISLENELNTLIIVSHDIENTLSISDTVLVLAKPQIESPATIVRKFDLMEMGLSWRSNIKDEPEFRKLIKEVKSFL